MTYQGIIEAVRAQIAGQGFLAAAEATALLEIVETIELQRETERELVLRAELDQKSHQALVAAHDALLAGHVAEVTLRSETEEALKQSEERFQAFVDAVQDYAIYMLDPTGRVISWNSGAERITGYTADEIVGGYCGCFYPEEELRQGAAERHLAIARDRGRIAEEGVRLRKDGSRFWAHCSTTALGGDRSETRGFAVILRDITSRVQAEQALRESEARFRVLFEHSPDSILLLDPHDPRGLWPIVDCNEVACRMNGFTREELIGRGIDTLHGTEADPAERAAYLERLYREGTIHVEAIHRRKDGTTFPVEISTSLITLNGHELVLGIDRDISDRRRAEENQRFLAEASTVLQSSLDYTATLQRVADLAVSFLADWCGVVMVEDNGSSRLVAAVHADPEKVRLAEELFQKYPIDPRKMRGSGEVLRTGAPILLPHLPDERLAEVAYDERQLELMRSMGFASAMMVPIATRGRTLGVISFVASAARPSYGSEDLRVAEELAQRAALAVDNARLYQDVQRALDARDEFLSLAAHELKAPLTTLFGSTRLLQQWAMRGENTGSRIQEVLGLADGAAQNLDKLIDSLIDFARIQSGRLSLNVRPVDLCSLIRLVLEELDPAPNHTVELVCASEPLIVDGDEMRLELVLNNLLLNAIKYSPRGGTIAIRLDRVASWARLAISDQGIGIPEAAQTSIFQRFFRASNADQEQIAGTGIGLYLVNEIVMRHGGTVEVESVEGTGSTFTVILPLRITSEGVSGTRLAEPQYAARSQ